MPLSIVMPPRCVKCNQAATFRWSKTVYWQHPLFYLSLFAGILVGAIVILAVRKKAYIDVGLCAEHRKKRGQKILIAWLSAAAALGLLVLAIVCFNGDTREVRSLGGVFVTLSILAFLFAIIWGIIVSSVVGIRQIKDGYAWYSGASPEYVSMFSAF